MCCELLPFFLFANEDPLIETGVCVEAEGVNSAIPKLLFLCCFFYCHCSLSLVFCFSQGYYLKVIMK